MKEALDYIQAQKEKIELELAMKELNKHIFELEQKLYDSMQSMDMGEIEIEGIKFKPDIERGFAMNPIEGLAEKWDDPAVHEWFKENNMADLIKVKEAIHPQTRLASLKNFVDEGGKIPEFMKETTRERIKFSKAGLERLVKGNG